MRDPQRGGTAPPCPTHHGPLVAVQEVLHDAGWVLGTGLVAIPVAGMLRVPPMIMMVAGGLAVGPSGLDFVHQPLGGLGSRLVFTFGVALILFHGGLGVSLRVISRTAVGLAMLVLPGVLLTAGIVAAVAAPVFGVPLSVALLVGMVMAPTDPAILIPLFERMRLRRRVSQTIIAESAFNDPTASVLAVAVAGTLATDGGVHFSATVWEVLRDLGLGLGLGVTAGLVLAAMLSSNRWGVWSDSPVAAVLALVIAGYATTNHVGGSAYLAAFIMGLVVGNMRLFGFTHGDEEEKKLEFTAGQLSELATLCVFVLLGINLPLDSLRHHLWGGLLVVAVFMFVARPLVVWLCLSVDRRARWTRPEKLFLSWSRETGAVSAALAALFLADGVRGADLAVGVVSLAILATLLLQATTAGWVAGRLGLVEPDPAPERAGG